MFDKLKRLDDQYGELSQKLVDPEVMNDKKLYTQTLREHADVEDAHNAYNEYTALKAEIEGLESMLGESDGEMKQLVSDELSEKKAAMEELTERVKFLLMPKDPNDGRNAMLEIRAGTGGEEASLFAASLYRMYSRYAERHRFKVEVMSLNETDLGGIKEIVVCISGKNVFSRLKFESGVHRVQRVPETESQGRVHTSAATVAVMPEAEDVEVEINENDIRVDVFRSGGHGGQSVNTTDSAVRITHLPSGLVVTCQDEKSQLKNKEKAMRVLKSRLYDLLQREQQESLSEFRKNQVGSGDRSERIRTYNFPQGRVTDHRIGLTVYKLDAFMDGECDEVIDALILAGQENSLQE